MRTIDLDSNYWIEIQHQSDLSFRVEVYYRYEISNLHVGMLYGNYIEESASINEYGRPHWQLYFYLETDNRIEISEIDFKRMFSLVKSNGLFNEPAVLMIRKVDPDFYKSFQIGRIYEIDHDPYPSLDAQI